VRLPKAKPGVDQERGEKERGRMRAGGRAQACLCHVPAYGTLIPGSPPRGGHDVRREMCMTLEAFIHRGGE